MKTHSASFLWIVRVKEISRCCFGNFCLSHNLLCSWCQGIHISQCFYWNNLFEIFILHILFWSLPPLPLLPMSPTWWLLLWSFSSCPSTFRLVLPCSPHSWGSPFLHHHQTIHDHLFLKPTSFLMTTERPLARPLHTDFSVVIAWKKQIWSTWATKPFLLLSCSQIKRLISILQFIA